MGGELVPVGTGTVALSGDAAGFHAWQAGLDELAQQAEELQELAGQIARKMHSNAELASMTAEQTAAAEVAARHVAQVYEVASALDACAAKAKKVASMGDAMAVTARAAIAAHNAEYRGIYEADKASPVPMAKPGFYAVR
ncbi:MAG: conjugal transfer protein TraB [Mycobacteriaceae bacterium]|nr:conjugal transfer protein TraB [Mycobacteriaceae bacterium]